MSVQPSKPSVWIEDEQRVREGADSRTVEALLLGGRRQRVDLRGTARLLKFRASYDRDGRYPLQAAVFGSERGVVVVTKDDLFRVGDVFYLAMHGGTRTFTVTEVRKGSRPGDALTIHVLYLGLK